MEPSWQNNTPPVTFPQGNKQRQEDRLSDHVKVILFAAGGGYIVAMTDKRKLIDLVSVGPATVADLEDLGITEVEHLINKDARDLFGRLHELRGARVDPCVEDVFRAAIEQARDSNLPREKRQWFYWSRVRKASRGR